MFHQLEDFEKSGGVTEENQGGKREKVGVEIEENKGSSSVIMHV